MSRVNPPLVKLVAACPVMLFQPVLNSHTFDWPPHERREFARAEQFVDENASRFHDYCMVARWACIMFSVIGAYGCWQFAESLYGCLAGLAALTLWCCSPYILGHGATIMADVPAAALAIATTYCFWRWIQSPDWVCTIGTGLLLGLAATTKFTTLVLLVSLPLSWFAYRLCERAWPSMLRWAREAAMILTMAAVGASVINVVYLFGGTFTRLDGFRFRTAMLTGIPTLNEIPKAGANRFVGTWLGRVPLPLPADFVQGIDLQQYDFERGLPSYLCGKWADHGWWYYYLYAMLIKMPLGTWLLVAMAVATSIRGVDRPALWRHEICVLIPLVVILSVVSSQTGFSVHSRYVIPALPFLFVWASRAVRSLTIRPVACQQRTAVIVVVIALTWYVGSSAACYPHCLSYFNELVGGPRHGGEHLLDSNIDWGQDLFHLRDWLDEHPGVRLDGLACHTSYSPTVVGIPSRPQPPSCPGQDEQCLSVQHDREKGPKPGWYALSVNYLYDGGHQYGYFLSLKPVAAAGYSIYVYNITLDEANRIRRELGYQNWQTNHR